jgi:hypothetical protein
VNVGRDPRRLIERTAPNEPDLRSSVLAEERHLAGRTSVDPLLAAVVTRHVDGLWGAGEQLHAIGLDQEVDHKGASGLPLAVQAMTAMREERIGRKPVANRSAGATTLTWDAHDLLPEDKATESGHYPRFRGLLSTIRNEHAEYSGLDRNAGQICVTFRTWSLMEP